LYDKPTTFSPIILRAAMMCVSTPRQRDRFASQNLEQQQKALTGLLDTCYTVTSDITMREGQLVKFDEEIRKYKQRELVATRQVASYKELRQRWGQSHSHIISQTFLHA